MHGVGSMTSILPIALVVCITPLALVTPQVSAQTAPMTSTGLNTHVSAPTPVGGRVQYNISGGTRPGGGANLFHSFGNFNVPDNTVANFFNDSGLPTENILGRVTGGDISHIYGTIRTTGFGDANLFLINPSGFLFGPNASLNVGGAVTFTSANYLKLEDGTRFNTASNPTADALLTSSPVEAFGFLGSNPGAITVQGSRFTVAPEKSLALIGGHIAIESGLLADGRVQPARASAPHGTILLASTASPGEFDVALQSMPNVNGASFTSFGSAMLASDSTVDVSGPNTVAIRGGRVVISVTDAAFSTAAHAGLPNAISLSQDSAIISSNAGTGAGADIELQADAITLNNVSLTALSSERAGGDAGNIMLFANHHITAQDSFVNTDAVRGVGQGGNIVLRTPTMNIDGGVLSASTSGTGAAGNVRLEGHQIHLSASPSAAAQGQAQGVDLFAQTSGSGHGGTISLHGLDGPSSHADEVAIAGASNVHTQTSSDGAAGEISIHAARFLLTDSATIKADTFGAGAAGSITITATQHATIAGPSSAMSSSSDFGATGHAGRIALSAPVLSLSDGGGLSTKTTGEGAGGNINIVATHALSLSHGASISTSSTGSGNAGNIQINAGQYLTIHKSSITAEATRSSGGNIAIQATDLIRIVDGKVSSSVQGSSSTAGGNITIDPNVVVLQGGHILANAVQGSGGNITITTSLLVADQLSRVDASSQFGLNGRVTIQSPTSNLSGTVGQLVSKTMPLQVLLQSRCAALAGGQESTFNVTGRDTHPAEPGGWLLSPLSLISSDGGPSAGWEADNVSRVSSPQKNPLLSLRHPMRPGFMTHTSDGRLLSRCAS